MRIISGKFKGRKFKPPASNWPTRPTTDFAREGLFNILQNNLDFESISVLDLFCGTGSHTYEFVSRGCSDVTCIDKFGGCIRFVKETIATLGIQNEVSVIKSDVFAYIKNAGRSFDYIFAGPPYALANMDLIPDLIFEYNLLRDDGWFVMEHNPNHDYKDHSNYLFERNYGTTIFSFFGCVETQKNTDDSEE